jgi:hypothetical protein
VKKENSWLRENISEAAAFVFSGSADAGIIALSLAFAGVSEKPGFG